MKKVIFGIFAHPDDEAFGPAGTLLKFRSEGCELHLIVVTDGEAGMNPDAVADTGETRLDEWQASARILGVTSTHALHLADGGLEKVPMADLDTAIHAVVSKTLSTYVEPLEVSMMTFEPHGLTGHRDHIAVSEAVGRLAPSLNVSAIWYFCLDKNQAPLDKTAYYEPCGREESYITQRINVTKYLKDKYRVIDAHHSQRGDAAIVKALGDERLSYECFHVES